MLSLGLYQRALHLAPDVHETYLRMARAHARLGQTDEALACCDQLLSRDPGCLAAHFAACMIQCPILYRADTQMLWRRHAYGVALANLEARLRDAPDKEVAQIAPWVGRFTPFYLIYQGLDCTDLQRVYGRILCRIMAARYPDWSWDRAPQRPPSDGPIRIAIASATFRNHSVWKMVMKGWLRTLDPDKFQLFGFSFSDLEDAETAQARASMTSFVTGARSVENWAKEIYAVRPHILLYPEVSMNQTAIKLSALRIAPVQCTTWATYVTSGLPTMDYFLSGDAMEVPDAQDHYSEQLIRLPGLSVMFEPPTVQPNTLAREDLSLRPGAVVYLCIQSLFKYLPFYDHLIARIAEETGDCQFVFLADKAAHTVTQAFENRLRTAFEAKGLVYTDHVVVLPTLSDAGFHRLLQLGDVFLDSIGVGGSTTTFEALAHDAPIVTCPVETLCSRVSAAALTRMGLSETIARDPDHFVDLAVGLGRSPHDRDRIRKRTRAAKSSVFSDRKVGASLQEALRSMVERP
ncbi:MAG: hypothetical protein Gyms2KO_23170 [Gymnodinialimonas sp.]